MVPFTAWYKLTPFQLEVIQAWERGDARALARLADCRTAVGA